MKNTKTTTTKKEIAKSAKQAFVKTLVNGLMIDYKTFASKQNKQNKQDLQKIVNTIEIKNKANESGLITNIKISNDIIKDFKKEIVTFASDLFLIKLEKIDDFNLKTMIAESYLSCYKKDFAKLDKKDADYIYQFGLSTYQFYKTCLFNINDFINKQAK